MSSLEVTRQAIDRLWNSKDELRIYESKLAYAGTIDQNEYLNYCFPAGSWRAFDRAISREDPVDNNADRFAVKHLIQWGKADTSVFKEKLGVEMPDWVHEFYSKIVCCVLNLRNCIYIKSPAQAVEDEINFREWTGETHLPVRFIRFVEFGVEGNGIAFGQPKPEGPWGIDYYWHAEGVAEHQSSDAPCPESDIGAMINRLLDTDGHPVWKGWEDEDCEVKRIR